MLDRLLLQYYKYRICCFIYKILRSTDALNICNVIKMVMVQLAAYLLDIPFFRVECRFGIRCLYHWDTRQLSHCLSHFASLQLWLVLVFQPRMSGTNPLFPYQFFSFALRQPPLAPQTNTSTNTLRHANEHVFYRNRICIMGRAL